MLLKSFIGPKGIREDFNRIWALRYMIPEVDVGMRMHLFDEALYGGSLVSYRDQASGRLVFGADCGGCDIHHPILEVETLHHSDTLTGTERFIVPFTGTTPYQDFMALTFNRVDFIDDPLSHISSLVRDIEACRRHRYIPDFDPGFALSVFPLVRDAIYNGHAVLGLDRITGMTALGFICDNCSRVHPAFLLKLPDATDLKRDLNLKRVEDPWRGLLPAYLESEESEPPAWMFDEGEIFDGAGRPVTDRSEHPGDVLPLLNLARPKLLN